MVKKNYIVLLFVLILSILIVTLVIYYNINNTLHSFDKSAGIVVPDTPPIYHFAVICENMDDPFWLSVKKGATKAALESNVAVEFNWPSSTNAEAQSKSLDMAIVSQVDGIVTYVWNGEETGNLIDKAVEREIPVVTINTDAKNSKRAAFVGVNTYSAGTEMGRMLLAATGGKGKAAILVSNEETGGKIVQSLMVSGITDAVRVANQLEIETIQYDYNNFLSLEDTIQNLIVMQPDLTAIVCTNDTDTTLVAQRLIDLNKINYGIVGYGDTEEILRYIDNGVVFGTVSASPEEMGYNAIKALVELKESGRTSAYFNVDTHVITKANVEKRLVTEEENE